MQKFEKIISLNNGNKDGGENLEIKLESGHLAVQADGAVLISCKNTSILCIVTTDKIDSAETDFFPLTVNYIEKKYAAGIIPQGYIKRENRQSEDEILVSRLIDRPLRPMFADGYLRNTQIVCMLMSYDKECDVDFLSIIGASAAVAVAKLPMKGIIAGIKVAYVEDEYKLYHKKIDNSKMNLVVAGTKDSILMVESDAKELSEEIMLNGIKFAHEHIKNISEEIVSFAKDVNKKIEHNFLPRNNEKLFDLLKKDYQKKLEKAYLIKEKAERKEKTSELIKDALEKFMHEDFLSEKFIKVGKESISHNEIDLKFAFSKIEEEIVKSNILSKEKRIDSRKLDEIREISVCNDFLKNAHGSAIFNRGLTQVLSIATLGSLNDMQQTDSMASEKKDSSFMLHYNFYPFASGEAFNLKAPGRREIGHGKLAYRAIAQVMPNEAEFPYTTRIVSEVLSSDGSTSMATVCSASMALMSAGVPIKSQVAGIAMGLIKQENEYKILTDIMADEDHLGDMDFKVAGTKDGITALQMDIKIDGITIEIMKDALEAAKKARMQILEKMNECICMPRSAVSGNAPRHESFFISKDKIPAVIGKSGSVIKKLCEDFNVKIDVSQDGLLTIYGNDIDLVNKAKTKILSISNPVEVGLMMNVKIKEILSFGLSVIFDDKTGLIHISEISNSKDNNLEMMFKIGQELEARYIGVDNKNRAKFSLLEKSVRNNDNEYKRNKYNNNNKYQQRNYRKSDKKVGFFARLFKFKVKK